MDFVAIANRVRPGEPDSGPPSGFTLLEMIVVIAIILVLLMILVPSFGSWRDRAYRVKCMSNVRQLALGAILYAGEHDGLPPYPNWNGAGESRWAPGWAYDRTKAFNGDLDNLTYGALWPFIKDFSVYRCPTDPREKLPADACAALKLSDYVMNGAVIGYNGNLAFRSYPLSMFMRSDVLFWEGAADRFAAGNDCSQFPAEGMEFRHRGGGMVACVDAHGEWMSSSDYYRLAGSSSGRNRFWCEP